jgi:hypothetical protein
LLFLLTEPGEPCRTGSFVGEAPEFAQYWG